MLCSYHGKQYVDMKTAALDLTFKMKFYLNNCILRLFVTETSSIYKY